MPLTPIQKRNVVQHLDRIVGDRDRTLRRELIERRRHSLTAAGSRGRMLQGRGCDPAARVVKQVPKGELHSPYPDYAKLAKDDPDLVKQFRLPGCNECHGGGGGGGICPALTQGVWFWGNTDDVLFRLVTLGSWIWKSLRAFALFGAPSPFIPRTHNAPRQREPAACV